MGERTSWKHLSSRARELLDGENEDAAVLVGELEEVEPELLGFVADAGGGALLVGVEGAEDGDGSNVVGCDVDEAAQERVRKVAERCEPPLAVSVYAENTSRVPFLRVEIPAGPVGEEALKLALDGISTRMDSMSESLEAARAEIGRLREQVDAGRASDEAVQSRLDKLQKTTGEGISRIRALARHLGADDKLVAWERRQLRTLLTTAIDLAAKRSRPPGESDDVVRQMRKRWSKLSEWVNEELVDPLQRDAQEMLRTLGEDPEDEG